MISLLPTISFMRPDTIEQGRFLSLLAARPVCCVSSKFPYAGLRKKTAKNLYQAFGRSV
jgi:hypothetical protein